MISELVNFFNGAFKMSLIAETSVFLSVIIHWRLNYTTIHNSFNLNWEKIMVVDCYI